jgi:hypothetical protein
MVVTCCLSAGTFPPLSEQPAAWGGSLITPRVVGRWNLTERLSPQGAFVKYNVCPVIAFRTGGKGCMIAGAGDSTAFTWWQRTTSLSLQQQPTARAPLAGGPYTIHLLAQARTGACLELVNVRGVRYILRR